MNEGAFVLRGSPNLPDTDETTLNEHPALTLTVRISSVATLLGESKISGAWGVEARFGRDDAR